MGDTFLEWVGSPQHTVFTDRQIDRAICVLRKNVSAGTDGVSAEYFIYGNSEILRAHLLAIYNSMFTRTTVPSVLVTGIIIPILKKSTLNPNILNDYRPITLGSTHGKLIELLILPADMAHPNQFGSSKLPWQAIILVICLYIVNPRGPRCVYVVQTSKDILTLYDTRGFSTNCSIFSFGHIGFFLYKWYKSMECIVRWDGSSS